MDAREIELLVNELETRVDRLRSLYEQYFMGIERMAPSVAHKDVERRIQVMRKEQIRNTAVRFRFQMIIQRYNTYQTHWQRICRQIEEGTYKRDMLRAKKRFKPAEEAAPQTASEPPPSIDITFSSAPPPEPIMAPIVVPVAPPPPVKLDLDDLALPEPPTAKVAPPPLPPRPKPVVPGAPRPVWRKVEPKAPGAPAPPPPQPAPVTPPPPVAAAPKPPPPAAPKPAPTPPAPRSPADLSDERLRQLYSQYVQTRRSRNESTAAITYDAMAKSLRESGEKLREKHGKAVDFEVAVKDGKTVLKPVVKKPSTQ